MQKLSVSRFALAGGLLVGLMTILVTAGVILKVPGTEVVGSFIAKYGSSYGYTVSWLGALIGGFWGFVKGFIIAWAFALIYDGLLSVGKKKQ